MCKAIIRFGANNSLDIVHARQSFRHLWFERITET